MDNIIQTERLHYEKICGERRSEIKFHDLMNNCPVKKKNLKPQESISPFFSSVFFFQKHPPKDFLEKNCSKISQNSVENFSFCGGFLFNL